MTLLEALDELYELACVGPDSERADDLYSFISMELDGIKGIFSDD